jgi:hypothetical protein
MLGAALFAGSHLQGQPAAADGTADSDLFSLTNQDRTSNGVAALADDSTLDSIGEAAPYSGCAGAGTIDGRAQDMINRDYFAHAIPPCNQYVFSMMSAFGVHYQSAGENVGWVDNEGSADAAAQWINQSFMQSPDHEQNILDPSYTDLGIGSATSQSWTPPGASAPAQGVWMFAEEFAQLPSAATAPPATAPPATAPPATAPPATAPPATAPRATAPPATAPPATAPPATAPRATAPPATARPVATPTPTPAPTPTPTPTPTPVPTPRPTATPSVTTSLPLPAYEYRGQGLISDTIESALEAFLFD